MASKVSVRAEAAKATQEAVLGAAVELFLREGYKQSSIEQIAEMAGVAKGTIYIYYNSKKALFRAVCQVSVDAFLARIEEVFASTWKTQRECLEAVLLAKFVYFHDLVSGSEHSLDLLQTGREIGQDIYEEGDRIFLEQVIRATKQAVDAGELAVETYDETSEGLGTLLVAACHGVSVSLPTGEYERQLRRMIAAILRGHAP